MLKWIKDKISKLSGWQAAGSIFLARMGALFGASMAFVGSMDLSPLWSLFTTGTDFTQRQLMFMGIGIFGTAITAEITRRFNSNL